MSQEAKAEMKSIKITASTHARLLTLSSVFNQTISEVIDDMMEIAYPEAKEKTEEILGQMESLKKTLEPRRQGKSSKND